KRGEARNWKKESHPSWNSGKEVYLYKILENKFILPPPPASYPWSPGVASRLRLEAFIKKLKKMHRAGGPEAPPPTGSLGGGMDRGGSPEGSAEGPMHPPGKLAGGGGEVLV